MRLVETISVKNPENPVNPVEMSFNSSVIDTSQFDFQVFSTLKSLPIS